MLAGVPFEPQGGIKLALASLASVASLLSVFGTLVFWVVIAPRALAGTPPEMSVRVDRLLLRMTRAGLAAGLAGILAWLAVETADLAGAGTAAKTLAALPTVLRQTWFGHLILLQLAVLLGLAALLAGHPGTGRRRGGLAVAGLAIVLQAGHSHAFAMAGAPSLLLASVVVHLAAAGAWLGSLLPLLLVVRAVPPKTGALAARRYSPVGKICVVAIAVSAAWQGRVMIASVAGLVGTAYGWMALVKLALFAVLVGFALANRYRCAPALLGGDPRRAQAVLVRSLAAQTGFGVAVIAAAVVLSNLPPAMHEQPLWPFPFQPSLDAVREDPDIRREVIEAALALAGAAALLVLAVLSRRVRWPVTGLAAVIVWQALPHLDVLLVDADPTSFYRSPTGFAAATIVAGGQLYPGHCAVCHGAGGHGDGPAAKSLPIPPADLTAAHLLAHTDGELFWWLTHGIAGPTGAAVMPGFAAVLTEDARWDLIDFIRARNAGAAMADTGAWPPLRAPDFSAACGDRTMRLAGLQGRFVRLVIGPAPAAPDDEVLTISTAAGACTTDDEAVPAAYAIVAGVARLPAGTQFLIDGAGWLRAIQKPGAAPNWNDPGTLAQDVRTMRAHPVAAAPMMMDMKTMDMKM